MRIVVPSRGRASRLIVLEQFSRRALERTVVVVPRAEVAAYRASVPLGATVLGMSYTHIGDKRQKIMNLYGDEKFVMIDDDLSFRRRGRRGPYLFDKCTKRDVDVMLRKLERLLDHYPLAGIIDSFMAQWMARRNPEGLIPNRRMNQLLAYNVGHLFKRPRFRLATHEELDVQLQLISMGHTTMCSNEFTKNSGRTGAEGGCSIWRTRAVENQQLARMVELWPRFVTIVSNGNSIAGRSAKIAFQKAAEHYSVRQE